MIEPPQLYTVRRRHYDISELEKLACLSVEHDMHRSPLVQRAFFRLIESIGTRQFVIEYSLVYKYIIMQQDCNQNRSRGNVYLGGESGWLPEVNWTSSSELGLSSFHETSAGAQLVQIQQQEPQNLPSPRPLHLSDPIYHSPRFCLSNSQIDGNEDLVNEYYQGEPWSYSNHFQNGLLGNIHQCGSSNYDLESHFGLERMEEQASIGERCEEVSHSPSLLPISSMWPSDFNDMVDIP